MLVPVTHKGVEYCETYVTTMEEREPFDATLVLIGFADSRSGTRWVLQGPNGDRYYMAKRFWKKLLLQGVKIQCGLISGIWDFEKRGPYFSIKLIEERD